MTNAPQPSRGRNEGLYWIAASPPAPGLMAGTDDPTKLRSANLA
jgi:hypothetical protein